ncbi:MAG: mercury resistance system periplasmic binding protein MerP [Gallionella sp.]|nr:mercury resistance system periplasmic binding protein MerP [Gallionella sp.]
MKIFFVAVALTVLSTPVWAASRTVTLSIPSMDCEVCPITVKKALSKVPGVSQSTVNFDKRQATVTFDDSKTSVDALTRATMDAIHPHWR